MSRCFTQLQAGNMLDQTGVPAATFFTHSTIQLLLCVLCACIPPQSKVVYPDAYRLRILNGCNSRTMQLRFAR